MSTARRIHTTLAVIVAVLVLIQAVIAGRALFGSWSITVHGVLGNSTFAVAVALVAAAAVARAGRHAVVVAVLLAVVLTTQIGLGYAGRNSAEAAAWHIPNGVLAFGLAVHQLGLTGRLRRPT
ncbi:MAG TPA: hypothetical protein VIR58_03760 [Acidimicrobiales bacterium]